MREAEGSATISEIVDELRPFLAHQRHKWAALCKGYGLSMLHFQVLTILDADGPTPMSRLAEQLDVGLPNVTGLIGRLEERGVVARTHDAADRRVVLATLTDEGARMLREVDEVRLARIAELVASMAPEDQETVLAAFRLMRAARARMQSHTHPDMEHAST